VSRDNGSIQNAAVGYRVAYTNDIFISMKRVKWDTLMFFYGVMLCVAGLRATGISRARFPCALEKAHLGCDLQG
jgi:hypothetical protein